MAQLVKRLPCKHEDWVPITGPTEKLDMVAPSVITELVGQNQAESEAYWQLA